MPTHRGEDLELGVPGLVAVVLLFFVPVFSFVLRRRWKMAVARKEEIRRLVMYASEEAARAEIEHHFTRRKDLENTARVSFPAGFGLSVVGPTTGGGDGVVKLCAVCYSPTTTRCSRCKAVRYCSGKCQIIHWRQGHRDECYPPTDIQHDDAPGTSNVSKTTTDDYFNNDASSASFCSPNVSHKGNEAEIRRPGTDRNGSSTVLPPGSASKKIDVALTSVKHVSFHPSEHDNHSTCDITSSISRNRVEPYEMVHAKSSPVEIATTTSHVNSSFLSKFNDKVAGFSVEEYVHGSEVNSDSLGFDDLKNGSHSSCQDFDSESILNCNGRLGLSKRRGGKINLASQLEPKHAAAASQSFSGSRTYPDQGLSYVNNGLPVPELNDSSSRYFDTTASKGSDGEFLPIPKASKIPSKPSAVTGTHGIQGNHVSGNTPSTISTPLMKPSGNSSSVLNGGYALKSSVRRVVEQLKPLKPSKPYKVFRPYDLYIKLYNERMELQPSGLTNCGNSCYANAVLQCLTFTRPLTAYLLQRLHSKTCPKSEWCFTCELENLVVMAKQGKSPLSPVGILSQIHKLGSNLGHGKEEDAHEFLRCAIDAMQQDCLGENGKSIGTPPGEVSLMQLIFGGYLRSKIRCMRCYGTSERYERMMDLTVEIGPADIKTLEQALARFTTPEILDGENMYKCSRCKSYEKAKKRLTLLEAPNVLTIALKRFQSGKFGKLNKTVQFPEILNMANYMSSGSHDKSPVYCLYAVVVHLDIMNSAFSGHYVCYVKNPNGKWYKIDDSKVKPVEIDRVLSKGAYMLLYARVTPRAPSLIKHDALPLKVKKGSKGIDNEDIKFRPRSNHAVVGLESRSRRLYGSHKVDSSSESSSWTGFSDEGSVSTESTRDSISTDDYSDYTHSPLSFGSYPSESISSDSNSASDLSSLGEEDAYNRKCFSYGGGYTTGSNRVPTWQVHENIRVFPQGKECSPFLYSDSTKQCRNLTERYGSR